MHGTYEESQLLSLLTVQEVLELLASSLTCESDTTFSSCLFLDFFDGLYDIFRTEMRGEYMYNKFLVILPSPS